MRITVRGAIVAVLTVCMCRVAVAQTDGQIMLKPWPSGSWGETNDKPLYQAQSDGKDGGGTAQIFWWDSNGRFRFSKEDPNALTIGYRWVTMNMDSNDPLLPRHLDEMSMALGAHLGKFADGDVTFAGGAGYSSNSPFADSNGIFGIGHLAWQRKLSDENTMILSLDYNGNSSFLPDVPLPGGAYVHREKSMSYGVGFPDSFFDWELLPKLTFSATYSVPYTAFAQFEYEITKNWSVFAGGANFFNGFAVRDVPITTRLFYQMSRAELGVRFRTIWKNNYIDFALTGGYAFHQRFSSGFDIRDLDHVETLTDVPYVGMVIVGRF